MTMRQIALLGCLCVPMAAFAEDAKVAGTWKIEGDVQGYPIRETCTLKGGDANLTGSCVGEKTVDATGVFQNGMLTLRHPGEYEGQPLTLTFTGKVAGEANWSGAIDVQPLGYDGSFTAKKEEVKEASR